MVGHEFGKALPARRSAVGNTCRFRVARCAGWIVTGSAEGLALPGISIACGVEAKGFATLQALVEREGEWLRR